MLYYSYTHDQQDSYACYSRVILQAVRLAICHPVESSAIHSARLI